MARSLVLVALIMTAKLDLFERSPTIQDSPVEVRENTIVGKRERVVVRKLFFCQGEGETFHFRVEGGTKLPKPCGLEIPVVNLDDEGVAQKERAPKLAWNICMICAFFWKEAPLSSSQQKSPPFNLKGTQWRRRRA